MMSLDQNNKLEEGLIDSAVIHDSLVQLGKDGDKAAQGELYKLYAKAMYNICRRFIPNEEDAKDVLQDAFIDAFSKLHTLNQNRLFAAWLKKIVINRCISSLRKKRIEFSEVTDEWHDEVDAQDDFLTAKAHRVMKAIEQISDGCRTVLNLYLFEGYDHSEIGEILGITTSTSKAQYSKAKMKIREILKA